MDLRNIAKAFETIKTLFPMRFSAVLYGCLLFPVIQEMAMDEESNMAATIACGVVYDNCRALLFQVNAAGNQH
jgi:hypothetical protein